MRFKSLFASIAAALLLCFGAPLAQATPVSTDISDLWYTPSEPGWGVNLSQQGDIAFLTMYVYNSANQPVWYTASNLGFLGTDQNGYLVFAGPLYASTGPYFGTPAFNPASVVTRQVGTALFTLTNLTTATLSYSVDGVSVSKNIMRMLWRVNDMSGSYLGGEAGTNSSCAGLGVDGYAEESGTFAINHSSDTATISFTGPNATCIYSGRYGQAGKMGLLNGSFNCTNGHTGDFQMFAIETQITGIQGRLTYSSNRCNYTGRFGGIRRGS